MEKMRKRGDTEDYEVGYGRPPKGGQFTKGASGNPSGRPKKASDFDEKLLRELNSPLPINENGKRKIITKGEAITKQLVNKAASGKFQCIRLVSTWGRQALEKKAEEEKQAQDRANRTVKDLSDEELAAIIRDDLKPLRKMGGGR